MLLVVLIIAPGFQLGGVHGADAAQPALRKVRPAALTLAGAGPMQRCRLPNPFVLDALA
jgi:hypothetical protein